MPAGRTVAAGLLRLLGPSARRGPAAAQWQPPRGPSACSEAEKGFVYILTEPRAGGPGDRPASLQATRTLAAAKGLTRTRNQHARGSRPGTGHFLKAMVHLTVITILRLRSASEI